VFIKAILTAEIAGNSFCFRGSALDSAGEADSAFPDPVVGGKGLAATPPKPVAVSAPQTSISAL